ncbi:membrane dipeptidase [Pseudomonas sp. LFM046]|uniref:dipeptidase n=1 Tax=Pseudomonas sp. LFM046 TaxID=1608357 RepID=UPI000698353A|nr:membrane dipeptidase [Pseudomonas sp. LFM046]
MDMNQLAPLLWDNHIFLPNIPGTRSIEQIERHRQAGFNVAFLNLGDADRDLDAVIRMAAFFRRWIAEHSDRFILLSGVEDVARARREGKLAIGFNLEGMYAIRDQADLLSLLYDLGVRWALFVYNRQNLVGCGVHDPVDEGLTPFGRKVVAEMDRIGMIKCLSHTGHRTVRDILACSELPCIFSHSNADAVWPHPRNIPDELIVACAQAGGVICVNGIDLFLGPGNANPLAMADHVDHIVQQVGVDHVGIGIDYGYTVEGEPEDPPSDPAFWPASHYSRPRSEVPTLPPECISQMLASLRQRGYSKEDIAKVAGENMLRVAQTVWR